MINHNLTDVISQDFMYLVFDLLSICAYSINQGFGDTCFYDEALNRVPELWRAVYEHRHVLDLGIIEEHGLSTEVDALEIQLIASFLVHHTIYIKRWRSVLHCNSWTLC